MAISVRLIEECASAIAAEAPAESELAEKLGASSEAVAAIGRKARELLSTEAVSTGEASTLSHTDRIESPLVPLGQSDSFDPFFWLREPTVTPVPTRIIEGSPDGVTITDKTVSIDVLSPTQLFNRVETEAENGDLFPARANEKGRLHYLNYGDARQQTHVTLSVGRRIVGVAGLQTNMHNQSQFWVQHVSVDPLYRGNGYASRILESVYDYALRRNQVVAPTSFTELGQPLKAVHLRLDALYPKAASGLPFTDF